MSCFPGTNAVCPGGSTVPLGRLGSLCLAEHLVTCLPDLAVSSLPAWEGPSLAGVLGVTALPAWEEALSPGRWETA